MMHGQGSPNAGAPPLLRSLLDGIDTLSRLEQRLPASRFLRIHRSTIVNVERIRELQPWFQGTWVVILADGTRLRTGARYQDNVRAYLERVT